MNSMNIQMKVLNNLNHIVIKAILQAIKNDDTKSINEVNTTFGFDVQNANEKEIAYMMSSHCINVTDVIISDIALGINIWKLNICIGSEAGNSSLELRIYDEKILHDILKHITMIETTSNIPYGNTECRLDNSAFAINILDIKCYAKLLGAFVKTA